MRSRNLKSDVGWCISQVKQVREILERLEPELYRLRKCDYCQGEGYEVSLNCLCDEDKEAKDEEARAD